MYINTKNINYDYTLPKFNYNYHSKVFYKENINLYSKLKLINKLITKLKKLITIC